MTGHTASNVGVMTDPYTPADPPLVNMRSDIKVTVMDVAGGDHSVLEAMLVSTDKIGEATDVAAARGRINYLMKNKHGSPFEHAMIKAHVEAPIFVFREWHRHRIGFSYNEVSGRYTELKPDFYAPGPDRPIVQVGKQGAYEYVPASPEVHDRTVREITMASEEAWASYQGMIADGVALEVARMVLPVNIYSAMVVTCNPRSLMAFLALRTRDDRATFKSKPMFEINLGANELEAVFAERFPLTHETFNENGRVAP